MFVRKGKICNNEKWSSLFSVSEEKKFGKIDSRFICFLALISDNFWSYNFHCSIVAMCYLHLWPSFACGWAMDENNIGNVNINILYLKLKLK